jgi:hypothetical protein
MWKDYKEMCFVAGRNHCKKQKNPLYFRENGVIRKTCGIIAGFLQGVYAI